MQTCQPTRSPLSPLALAVPWEPRVTGTLCRLNGRRTDSATFHMLNTLTKRGKNEDGEHLDSGDVSGERGAHAVEKEHDRQKNTNRQSIKTEQT